MPSCSYLFALCCMEFRLFDCNQPRIRTRVSKPRKLKQALPLTIIKLLKVQQALSHVKFGDGGHIVGETVIIITSINRGNVHIGPSELYFLVNISKSYESIVKFNQN